MNDLVTALAALPVDANAFAVSRPRPFCLVIEPRVPTERDFLHDDLLAPAAREAFWDLVDATGLVVVRGVHADPSTYRDVRGRSSRGRLSQGEYFHHDGCSGPTKPRVVEIRCPYQTVARSIATSVAPFPATVYAMLRALPPTLADNVDVHPWRARLEAEDALPPESLDLVQGLVTRAVRRGLSAADARAYFREVDRACDAYDEPWQMGESRFIANANATATTQHRRAYATTPAARHANGKLLKRWPAEELVT
jgi:hypothetical protein